MPRSRRRDRPPQRVWIDGGLLQDLVELIDDDYFNARFPAEGLSRVVIETSDGQRLDSGVVQPLWDLDVPSTDDELREKFRTITHRYLPSARAETLESMIWEIESLPDVSNLLLNLQNSI